MTEFDKLRALLDFPQTASFDGDGSADISAFIDRQKRWRGVARGRLDSTPRTARRRGWMRALWMVLVVVTTLDAIYLLAKALAEAAP